MLLAWVAGALAGTATLRVGVAQEAGSAWDIAADGASGQCVVGPALLACPADGPVTFRWGGDAQFALEGDAVVAPGAEGIAWVLAAEETRAAERARLAAPGLTAEVVGDLFVRTSADPVSLPSLAMLGDLFALAEHPDWTVRRAVVDAIIPYLRRDSADPLGIDAPSPVPPSLVTALAGDPDPRVRRRLAGSLKEYRPSPATPGHPDALTAAVREALNDLLSDQPAVQRAAIGSMSASTRTDAIPVMEAWNAAIDRVRLPGPPGNAAAASLARMASQLEASPEVDPRLAVELTLAYHTEKAWLVWGAWCADVPFRRDWVDRLFRSTEGLSQRLLKYWSEQQPEQLAAAIAAWEPAAPHSDRFALVRTWLAATPHPGLRAALGLGPVVPARPKGKRGGE